jgi:hypothetical protein
MLVERKDPEHLNCNDLITEYSTKLLWSSDGWVYDLTNNTRRQFFTTDNKNIFRINEEKGIFSITDIQYEEDITIKILQKIPKIWQEGNDVFCVIDQNC